MKESEANLLKKASENIRKFMKQYYYHVYELAEVLNITPSQFYNKINMKNGKFNIAELKALADEFYISLDEIIK